MTWQPQSNHKQVDSFFWQ